MVSNRDDLKQIFFMLKTSLILLGLAGSLTLAGAQSLFTVNLDGPQAGTPSLGNGVGTLTLNLDNTVSYEITFSGLTAAANNAHIHGPGAPGVTAGVVKPLTFPLATSGDMSGTTTALSEQQAADMLAGLHYVNIHSSFAPAGEIRGQILLVPEPSAVALAGLGLGTISVLRRRGRAGTV